MKGGFIMKKLTFFVIFVAICTFYLPPQIFADDFVPPPDFEAKCKTICNKKTSNDAEREQCYRECSNITQNPNIMTGGGWYPKPKKCKDIKKTYHNCLEGATWQQFIGCYVGCEAARWRLRPCDYDCLGELP